eukprot:scaffold7897_cov20-Tisochrysis_lutea.AAC.4
MELAVLNLVQVLATSTYLHACTQFNTPPQSTDTTHTSFTSCRLQITLLVGGAMLPDQHEASFSGFNSH